jgi:hypothetical protein
MTTIPRETPLRGLSLLGLVSSGDLGGITCYRSHLGKIVQFAKTWPKHPPTLAQLTGRARMSFAAEQWRGFNATNKNTWRRAAHTSSLCATGYNLWIKWHMCHNPEFQKSINDLDTPGLMDAINRTQPVLPANPKIQVSKLSDPPIVGRVRYGRHHIFAPPGVTEWTTFLAYDPDSPLNLPLENWLSIWGPGAITHSPVLNGRWCTVSITTAGGPTESQIELLVRFPDGNTDQSRTFLHTRIWP